MAGERLALAAAFVAVVNPISWFDSVVWGQVDSFGVVFLLLGLRELWRDRPERAAVCTVIAAIIKPQLGHPRPARRRRDHPARAAGRTRRRSATPAATGPPGSAIPDDRRWSGFLTTAVARWRLPFGLSSRAPRSAVLTSGLLDQIFAGGGYPYLTVNAYNPWALVPGDTGLQPRQHRPVGLRRRRLDADRCGSGHRPSSAPIPAVVVGTALLARRRSSSVLVVAARRPDRLTLLVGAGGPGAGVLRACRPGSTSATCYPFFALGDHPRGGLVALAVAYVVLSRRRRSRTCTWSSTALYPDNPQIVDWLGIGPTLQSEPAIAVVAVVFASRSCGPAPAARVGPRAPGARARGGVGAAARDARRGRPRPTRPSRRGRDPAPGVAVAGSDPRSAAGARPPSSRRPSSPRCRTWSPRPTMRRARADRMVPPAARRALRSAPTGARSLTGERGGRLDRLDLWFLVVLVLGDDDAADVPAGRAVPDALRRGLSRADGDGVPAVWRYGMSHDIYEWTHPHLAKYAMALGLVLWGEDHVSATSDLGVPVVALGRRAAARPTRASATTVPASALHIATGTEIRTYDLRTRALISTIAGPGRDRAGDRRHDAPAGHRLRGRPRGDARPGRDRPGRRRGRRRRRSTWPPWPAGGPAVRDARRCQRRGRPGRPSRCRGQRHRDRRGRHGPGGAGRRSPTAAAARRSWRHRRRARPVRRGVGAGGTPGRERDGLRGAAGQPRPDGRHGLAGQQGHPRQGRGRDRRRPARRAWRSRTCRASPPPPRGRHVLRPGHRLDGLDGRPDGRRARPGLHVGRGRPEAVCHLRRRRDPDLPRRRHRGRHGCRRPDRPRVPPAAGPRGGRRLRPRQPDGPHPRARARPRRARSSRRPRSGRPEWTVYVVEPHGNAVVRRCPARRGVRARAVGRRHQRRLPGERPPGAARLRRLRVDGVDRVGLARLRVAAPRRHRRRADGRPACTCCCGSCSGAGSWRSSRALRAGRRDVVRPVADRHERRLRRPLHRRRVHGVRRAVDGLVAGALGVLGGDARHRRPARPRARREVGGALCHRRHRHADPRAERAGPGRWRSSG